MEKIEVVRNACQPSRDDTFSKWAVCPLPSLETTRNLEIRSLDEFNTPLGPVGACAAVPTTAGAQVDIALHAPKPVIGSFHIMG